MSNLNKRAWQRNLPGPFISDESIASEGAPGWTRTRNLELRRQALYPLSYVGNGVVVQLVVFEEPLSLFAHGNTSPGHGWHLLRGKCYRCP